MLKRVTHPVVCIFVSQGRGQKSGQNEGVVPRRKGAHGDEDSRGQIDMGAQGAREGQEDNIEDILRTILFLCRPLKALAVN